MFKKITSGSRIQSTCTFFCVVDLLYCVNELEITYQVLHIQVPFFSFYPPPPPPPPPPDSILPSWLTGHKKTTKFPPNTWNFERLILSPSSFLPSYIFVPVAVLSYALKEQEVTYQVLVPSFFSVVDLSYLLKNWKSNTMCLYPFYGLTIGFKKNESHVPDACTFLLLWTYHTYSQVLVPTRTHAHTHAQIDKGTRWHTLPVVDVGLHKLLQLHGGGGSRENQPLADGRLGIWTWQPDISKRNAICE